MIGCECPVCTSSDPRDQRLRTAALLTHGDLNILIDTGPDLRQQMLRTRVRHLDAILLTHEHNDHVIGLDDIRPFNFRSGHPMTVYAQARVAADVRRRFEYIFGEPIPGLPRVDLRMIDAMQSLDIGGLAIQPVEVMHGRLPILGFRFGDLTYITDMKTITPAEQQKIYGTRYLIVNALHHRPHPTHMSLAEALTFIDAIHPQQAWLTHISHDMGPMADMESQLPAGVSFGYDGLEIEF